MDTPATRAMPPHGVSDQRSAASSTQGTMQKYLEKADRVLAPFDLNPELRDALKLAIAQAWVEEAETDRVLIEQLEEVVAQVRHRFYPLSDLDSLSIRQLKKLASDRQLPNYFKLTKQELIERLAKAEFSP